MIQKSSDFDLITVGNRTTVVKGVARLFYEGGFPLSLCIEQFSSQGIEVSLLHVADQCWSNGWSPSTIMKKLKGECDLDINKSMVGLDWNRIEKFCDLIDQPKRSNGGYEESREMLFQDIFGTTYEEVRSGKNTSPLEWL